MPHLTKIQTLKPKSNTHPDDKFNKESQVSLKQRWKKDSHSESASRGALLVDVEAKEIAPEDVSGSDGYDLDGDEEPNKAEHSIDEDGFLEVTVDVVVVEYEVEVRS